VQGDLVAGEKPLPAGRGGRVFRPAAGGGGSTSTASNKEERRMRLQRTQRPERGGGDPAERKGQPLFDREEGRERGRIRKGGLCPFKKKTANRLHKKAWTPLFFEGAEGNLPTGEPARKRKTIPRRGPSQEKDIVKVLGRTGKSTNRY